jgi:hypothetical protein
MIQIAEGMSPSNFIEALNSNLTEIGFTGRSVEVTSKMTGWEFVSGMKLNSYDSLLVGDKGSEVVTKLNTIPSLVDLSIAPDVKSFGAVGDGSVSDSAAINTALQSGNIIIQNGTFLLSESIKIPSNRIVYLKNCQLKMADFTYDNFFRNADMVNGNTNIKVLGLGNVELNGNSANNDDGDSNYAIYGPRNPIGGPYSGTIYRYNAVIFCNVDIFEISGLNFYDIPHWCTYLQYCSNGSFHDICHYDPIEQRNQDVVNVAHNSNNIDLYNIAAIETQDDFGAIVCGDRTDMGFTEFPNWNDGDIHDINFKNIHVYHCGAFSTILGGDGNKIYNIDQRNIILENSWCFHRGVPGYATVEPAKNDIYNITCDSIVLNELHPEGGINGYYCFYFVQSMMDFAATNIKNNTGLGMYILNSGDQSDNVTINGEQVV